MFSYRSSIYHFSRDSPIYLHLHRRKWNETLRSTFINCSLYLTEVQSAIRPINRDTYLHSDSREISDTMLTRLQMTKETLGDLYNPCVYTQRTLKIINQYPVPRIIKATLAHLKMIPRLYVAYHYFRSLPQAQFQSHRRCQWTELRYTISRGMHRGFSRVISKSLACQTAQNYFGERAYTTDNSNSKCLRYRIDRMLVRRGIQNSQMYFRRNFEFL